MSCFLSEKYCCMIMIKQSDYSMTVKTIIGEISMCMSLQFSVKNTDRK